MPPTGHGCQLLHFVEHYGRWMFDRTSKPIAVHLSCDDLVEFPIEMQVDGHFAYVPPDWLPLSGGLIADLRAYQTLWEQLPLPEEDLDEEEIYDGEDLDLREDLDDEDADDLEFEKLWRLTLQLQATADSDPGLARRLAEETETRAADLDESERQVLLLRLAAAISGFDLPWARTLVQEAMTLVRRIEDPYDRARALADLIRVVAGFDRGEAEALARDISDPEDRDRAILAAINEMSRAAPDRAELLAGSISHPQLRAWALARLADSKVVPGFPEWTEVLLAKLRAELGPDYIVRAI